MEARRAILETLGSYDRVSLQNILMAIPDREIAVALAALDEREGERILILLGPQKSERVREELGFHKRLFIRRDRYLKIIEKFLSYFGKGRKDYRDRSYIRPI